MKIDKATQKIALFSYVASSVFCILMFYLGVWYFRANEFLPSWGFFETETLYVQMMLIFIVGTIVTFIIDRIYFDKKRLIVSFVISLLFCVIFFISLLLIVSITYSFLTSDFIKLINYTNYTAWQETHYQFWASQLDSGTTINPLLLLTHPLTAPGFTPYLPLVVSLFLTLMLGKKLQKKVKKTI